MQPCIASRKSELTAPNKEAAQSEFFQVISSPERLAGLTSVTGNHQLTVWLALNVFETFLNQSSVSTYSPTTVVETLTAEEADIVHFVGGFVIKKPWARSNSTEQQGILTSFITDCEPENATLLAAKSHGRLTNITNEAKCMLIELEQVFRETVIPSTVSPSGNEAGYHKACQCNKVIQDCFHSSTDKEENGKSKDTVFFHIFLWLNRLCK